MWFRHYLLAIIYKKLNKDNCMETFSVGNGWDKKYAKPSCVAFRGNHPSNKQKELGEANMLKTLK